MGWMAERITHANRPHPRIKEPVRVYRIGFAAWPIRRAGDARGRLP